MLHFISSPVKLVLGLTLIAGVTGCDKDDDPVMERTITETVVNSDAFSQLETAVVKADLQATLNGTGPFTVFAPDNEAFEASGITSQVLNSLSKDQVANILLYHTFTTRLAAADVPAGPNEKIIAANGDSVFVTRNQAGVFVNGVKVKEANISASNGIIHRIGAVLLPPSGDIVATAQADGSGLDSLVKAVVRVNNAPGGDPTLISALQSARLTVFAPTNDAFSDVLDVLDLDDINDIPVATLAAVLKYHVVAGRVFSSDLANGQVNMLAGGSTTVNLNGGATITGNGNAGAKSNIVAANIMARNGVVHVIDRVLIP